MNTHNIHIKAEAGIKQLSLPVSFHTEKELEDIEVRFPKSGRLVHFRLEPLPWHINYEGLLNSFDGNTIAEKLLRLKIAFEAYENGWEIAMILTPELDAREIHVLLKREVK